MTTKPRALILHANGINRDHDLAEAIRMAGGEIEILHINQLRRQKTRWLDYQMLALPGGFSYADALGAGKLLALDLQSYFADQMAGFVGSGKPVIGVCNGFQALVKAGVLPGTDEIQATLTFNSSGHFECRWVRLQPVSKKCIWTAGLEDLIECPVAHGEGRFVTSTPDGLSKLAGLDQIALVYADENGSPAGMAYPANPSGSMGGIAGVCNSKGNVIGLMPHAENHLRSIQHPKWTRGKPLGGGLAMFVNGVRYADGV